MGIGAYRILNKCLSCARCPGPLAGGGSFLERLGRFWPKAGAVPPTVLSLMRIGAYRILSSVFDSWQFMLVLSCSAHAPCATPDLLLSCALVARMAILQSVIVAQCRPSIEGASRPSCVLRVIRCIVSGWTRPQVSAAVRRSRSAVRNIWYVVTDQQRCDIRRESRRKAVFVAAHCAQAGRSSCVRLPFSTVSGEHRLCEQVCRTKPAAAQEGRRRRRISVSALRWVACAEWGAAAATA
jgi:hypothetical protein